MRVRLAIALVLLVSSSFATSGCKLRDRLRRGRAATTSTSGADTALPRLPPPAEPPVDAWTEIDLYDIAISFPRTPQLKTRTENTPHGVANIRDYRVDYGESSFDATIVDMTVTAWNAQGSVDGAVTQGLAAARKTDGVLSVVVTSDTPKPFAGMPGRELVTKIDVIEGVRKKQSTYRMISLSRFGRNYMLIGIVSVNDRPILDRFFGSLRATPKASRSAAANEP